MSLPHTLNGCERTWKNKHQHDEKKDLNSFSNETTNAVDDRYMNIEYHQQRTIARAWKLVTRSRFFRFSVSAHMWHLVKETTECGSEVDILLTKAARWDVSNVSHIACGPANLFFTTHSAGDTLSVVKSHPNIIHSLTQFKIGLQYFFFSRRNEQLIRVPFILENSCVVFRSIGILLNKISPIS